MRMPGFHLYDFPAVGVPELTTILLFVTPFIQEAGARVSQERQVTAV
jgi:hypothetical protein